MRNEGDNKVFFSFINRNYQEIKPMIPYTGGCQCGQVRYEIHAEPLTLYLCHCKECQKQSSSAFGMSLTVPQDAVVILRGKPKAWTRKSDSGREVNNLFCGDCGTRLFHERAYNPNTKLMSI
jgi:hypothetical protein